MMNFGLVMDGDYRALIDMVTGEIYAEHDMEEIRKFMQKYEDNFTLQIFS